MEKTVSGWRWKNSSCRMFVSLGAVAGFAVMPVVVSAPPASANVADAQLNPGSCGNILLAGSSWLGGQGVDVKSNGIYQGSGTSCGGTSKVDGITAGSEWQCAELVNRLYIDRGWIKAIWQGNGGRSSASARDSMYDEAPGSLSKQANGSISYVAPGDVVSINDYDNGAFVRDGHVLVVNTAGKVTSGSVPLVSQNGGSASDATVTTSATLSGGTLTIPSSGSWSYKVIGVVHAPSGSGSQGASPLLGVLTTGGQALVKDGSLSAPWVTETSGVAQVAVANDAANGPLVAVLTTGGQVLVKEGSLSATWVTEASGVAQVAVASDSANGPLLAVLTTGGQVLVKEGSLSATWVTEASGVAQLSAASDPANGPLLAVLTTGGQVLVKEGSLSATWVTETSGVAQVAVASDSANGPLLAVLTTGGQVLVKEGSLSATWVTETSGVAQVAVASDSANGPLVAVLTTGGQVLVKEGSLSATWVTETSGIAQVAAAG
jgi:hypothetical protein